MEEEDAEDYISYGTPLPDIEDETTIRKKAAKELQVRDDKGRQRFHGAFTGGFSAGYFNTVGTKEGWAPSSFISSRNKISDRIQQNPEDFMDDEDLGEFGIATRKIHTTSNFQDARDVNARKRKYVDIDSVIPGEAPLKDIVKPVSESIGIKILTKYGWRQGQGIGPRVKKQIPEAKVYGCSPYPDAVVPEESDPMSLAYTFAPEDTDAVLYHPKDDYFGLGYVGLSKQSILNAPIDKFAPTATKSWLKSDKKKLSITGQAFGVGAFEDDDEDIYGKDDMSQYDFSEFNVKLDDKIIKGSGHSLQHGRSTDVLEGFRLASQPPTVKKYYPPPTVPPNFRPFHENPQSNFDHCITKKTFHCQLSADERSFILGEKKFVSHDINVDSKKNKEKPQLQEQPESLDLINKTVPSFRPFPNDPMKQQRYEEYIRLKRKGESEKFVLPSSMTEWEKQQEIEEFARASVLFKPLSDALNSRFESRSHLSVEHEVMGALEKIKKEKETKPIPERRKLVGTCNRKTFEWHPSSLLCRRFNIPNPYPDSHSHGVQKLEHRKSLFDHLSFMPSPSSSNASVLAAPPVALGHKTEKISEDMSGENDKNRHISTSPVVAQATSDNFENKRPSMDLFKDIFENSSSEDEDDTNKRQLGAPSHSDSPSENVLIKSNENSLLTSETDHLKESSVTPLVKEKLSPIDVKSSFVSKKAGFGVFANLDLDSLNQRTVIHNVQNKLEIQTNMNIEKSSITDKKIEEQNNNPSDIKLVWENRDYGPPLPPDYNVSSTCDPAESKSAKHRKHKSKHKHKHHKHKSSKKKKKKTSRKSSDSSESSDELNDIPPTLIIEKLKKLQRNVT